MLSRDLLRDYQYLINGHSKSGESSGGRSDVPNFKSRKTTNDDSISTVTIDGLEKEYYLNGIGIPQKMITIGGSDDYKLLDASNIDWNKTYLFWAEEAKKRGVWNNSPIQNEGRDIRSSFYPNYLWPSCEGTTQRVISYPQWADTGIVQNSDDVLDILNYLLWRVLSLDYFADNWDNVNTQAPEYFSLSWGESADWWKNQLSNDELYDELGIDTTLKQPLLNELAKYGSMPSGSDFTYLLDPAKADNNGKINIGTLDTANNELLIALVDHREEYSQLISKIAEDNYAILKFAILTNHPGPINDIWLKLNNIEVARDDDKLKLIPADGQYDSETGKFNLGELITIDEEGSKSLRRFVYGISTNGQFTSVGDTLSVFNQRKINVLTSSAFTFNADSTTFDGGKIGQYNADIKDLFTLLDSCSNQQGTGAAVSLNFRQEASTSDPLNKFPNQTKENFLNFYLQKMSNAASGLNFINNSTLMEWNEDIYISFRHDDNEKHEIVIKFPQSYSNTEGCYNELEDGDNSGIYPHFLVRGNPTSQANYTNYLKDSIVVDDENGYLTGEFIHNTNYSSAYNFGDVRYDSETNKYYYIAPSVEDYPNLEEDMVIYIYCLLYYRDKDVPRYINPKLLRLTVKLRPDVDNRIVFYDNKTNVYVYDNAGHRTSTLASLKTAWLNKDTIYYANSYNTVTVREIQAIFNKYALENQAEPYDFDAIDADYTFYRIVDNQYTSTPARSVIANTGTVQFYLEDNLHQSKETDYDYAVKTKVLKWNSEQNLREYEYIYNDDFIDAGYEFTELKIDSFSETVARSKYTKNVHVDFMGVLPSSLIEDRAIPADYENDTYGVDGYNEDRTIYHEPDYLNGYYEAKSNEENVYLDANLNAHQLNLPKTEVELLQLLQKFGVENTSELDEINGNKKFNPLTTIEKLKYSNGDTIPSTGITTYKNTFKTLLSEQVEKELSTNLFNLKYTYNTAGNAEERKVYSFEFKSSTAMFPLENGLFEGKDINDINTNVIYNADSDYYYLVFKISCPAGSSFGAAYRACHGYYFLRILRANSDDIYPEITFIDKEEKNNAEPSNYWQYTAYHDGVEKEYSFRGIPQVPIYLNRCLSDSCVNRNKKFKGLQWWFLAGIRDISESQAWSDSNIARDCFIISNVGDKYFRTRAGYTACHPNFNYSKNFLFEHEMDIRPVDPDSPSNNLKPMNGISGVTYFTRTVLPYKTMEIDEVDNKEYEMSGPFIYAKELMRIDTLNNNERKAITSDYIIANIRLMYGNDMYTIRKTTNGKAGLTFHKKEYDFNVGTYDVSINESNTGLTSTLRKITDLSESSNENYVNVFNYLAPWIAPSDPDTNNEGPHSQVNINGKILTGGYDLYTLYKSSFFILSNEFGQDSVISSTVSPSSDDFDNENQNIPDDIFSLFDRFSLVGQNNYPDIVSFSVSPQADVDLIYDDPHTGGSGQPEDLEDESDETISSYTVDTNDPTPLAIFIPNIEDRANLRFGRFIMFGFIPENTIYYNIPKIYINLDDSKDGIYKGKVMVVKFVVSDPPLLPTSTGDVITEP